jgi:hypothetical protein
MKKQLFGTYSLLALSIPAALLTLAPSAQAIEVILGSTATTALSAIGGSNVANITNQSGLSAAYTSGVTDFDAYVATTTNLSPAPSNFFLFNANSGVVTFNLGASYTLNALALWQFAAGTTTSVRGFNLYADTDADTSNLGTSLGSFNAINSATPIGAQVFNFSATPTQFIQLEITSNGNSINTGLGEVAFREATPVPWETDALPVVGATLLFVGGVWVKRKLAKPLDKE